MLPVKITGSINLLGVGLSGQCWGLLLWRDIVLCFLALARLGFGDQIARSSSNDAIVGRNQEEKSKVPVYG